MRPLTAASPIEPHLEGPVVVPREKTDNYINDQKCPVAVEF